MMSGCKPSVPSRYIQEGKMEDILYDYHVACGVASMNGADYNAESFNEHVYKAAVLKKHGVTEAEFDSSMVYYTRHTERLHKIYENLAERLSDEAKSLGVSVADANDYSGNVINGDTANIWKGDNSYVFSSTPPFNLYSFTIPADTAFKKGDVVVLSFDTQFIFQDGMRNCIAVLSLKYNNDSIADQVQILSSSSHFQLQLSDDKKLGIKEIRGYFLLTAGQSSTTSLTTLRLMCINKIRMVRVHPQENTLKNNDSNKLDSAHANQKSLNPDSEKAIRERDEQQRNPQQVGNQPQGVGSWH
jgi:hypothetical protein